MSEACKTVAVLMATYNGERFLREQLDSLLNQKDVTVKILVRDDNSKDSTVSILEEYKSKSLLQWYTGEHLGVEKNFLDLLRHAPEADYYAFCDQDDVWDDNKLSVAINHLRNLDLNKPG